MIVLRRGGLWGGIAKTTRLEKIAVLTTLEETDHHLLMNTHLMGDIQSHPSRSRRLMLGRMYSSGLGYKESPWHVLLWSVSDSSRDVCCWVDHSKPVFQKLVCLQLFKPFCACLSLVFEFSTYLRSGFSLSFCAKGFPQLLISNHNETKFLLLSQSIFWPPVKYNIHWVWQWDTIRI